MEAKHPTYDAAPFTWRGVLGWANASALGVTRGQPPHITLPRKGLPVTGLWLRSPKSGQAMFFRLQEAFPECWLYVSDRGIKLTVYNH